MAHEHNPNFWGWISAGGAAAALLVGAAAKALWTRSKALVAERRQQMEFLREEHAHLMAAKELEHKHEMAEKEAELRRSELLFAKLSTRVDKLELEKKECEQRLDEVRTECHEKIANLRVELRATEVKLEAVIGTRMETAAKQGAAQELDHAAEKVADKVVEKLPKDQSPH